MTKGPLSVRRLHVTSAAPLASRVGFVARMEDALRTSSPPSGCKGRLVLIRRLRMRAGERWPAHLLARRIEATWHVDAAQAVPASHAGPHAPAVWFADESSARLALIERLARGRDVSAWFWQRWLPPGTDVARRIAQLLVAPTDTTLAAEERLRYFEEACRAIARPELVDRVIACCNVEQLNWLLPESVLRANLQSVRRNSHPADSGAEGRSEPGFTEDDTPEFRAVARRLARAALGSRSDPEGPGGIDRRTEASPAPAEEGAYTEWAGLFFALNLFQWTGTPGAAAERLRDIAGFLRVAADDPLMALLERLGRRGDGRSESNESRASALRELRRACLRATRRPLRRVLHRAGRVHLNRTDLTIALRLAEVRLAVRVAGLDIDPGWVVALGRVVRFEYD
jgi:hypothetical protein